MEPITSAEYFQECQAIAREAVRKCEDEEDYIQNSLFEAVDRHQWIIYTFYNLQVLQHSKNDDAYFEEYGALNADGFSDAVQKMVFAAMLADVREEIADALSEYARKT